MSKSYSLSEITNALGGRVIGDDSILVTRVASLTNAQSGDISFINDAKYQKALVSCNASAYVFICSIANGFFIFLP